MTGRLAGAARVAFCVLAFGSACGSGAGSAPAGAGGSVAGTTGRAGTTGTAGTVGGAGAGGTAGSAGAIGVAGAGGATGGAGAAGTTGAAGGAGTTGAAGISGAAGAGGGSAGGTAGGAGAAAGQGGGTAGNGGAGGRGGAGSGGGAAGAGGGGGPAGVGGGGSGGGSGRGGAGGTAGQAGGQGGGQGCVGGTNLPLATNGLVRTHTVGPDGTIYFAGNFSQVGPPTGGAVPFNLASGQPAASYPKVNGAVFVIVSDGAGGFYLGGNFTHVGGLPRASLAHVLAGGVVDPTFAPSVGGAESGVSVLALGAGVLYLGGNFSSVSGQARNSAAAVDLSGAVTAWNPNVGGTTNWPISTIAVRGDTIYLGGFFSTVGGQERKLLAAVDKSGALLPWAPAVNPANSLVSTMVVGPDGTLYIGGRFLDIGGQPRERVAAFDGSGNLTAWAPTFGGSVYSLVSELAVSGTTIYAVGDFSLVNGATRSKLAALDTSGALLPFAPTVNGSVESLAIAGNQILFAGGVATVNGESRSSFAAVDLDGKLLATPNILVGSAASTVAVSGGVAYLGGSFTTLGGQTRNSLAAIDQNGNLTNWAPGPINYEVVAMAFAGGRIYIAGSFEYVGSEERAHLAALDTSGAVTSWNPGADNTVGALAVDAKGIVYVGGDFGWVGGQARANLAAIDTAGKPTSWNPSPDSWVNTILVSSNGVYVGGNFKQIGGQARNRLALIDSGGKATAFRPTFTKNGTGDGWVEVVGLQGDKVLAAGVVFDGDPKPSLVSFDTTGNRTAWNPAPNNQPTAFAVLGGRLFVAGIFSQIAGQPRQGLAAFDAAGALLPWDVLTGAAGRVAGLDFLGVVNGRLFAGGGFAPIGGEPRVANLTFICP